MAIHLLPEAPARAAVPSPAIEAVVQTGATETHYRRAGRGPAVLLLASSSGDGDGFAARLFDALAGAFRVIAPAPPAGDAPLAVSAWLRDVIDGLGLARPALVADESFGVAALGFALLDPGRAGRLVVVSRDHADPLDHNGASGDGDAGAPHPFLVLRVSPVYGEVSTMDVATRITRFLLETETRCAREEIGGREKG